MTTTRLIRPHTLADTNLIDVRCSRCSEELPQSAPLETYETPASCWIVAYCRKCDSWTPFQWEKE